MEKIRIQDDLYNYVNGKWIEEAVIPSDKATVGGFSDLAFGIEELLINDFKNMNEEDCNLYIKSALKLFNMACDVF